jgi:large subunit ribosomal protein L21
MYAVIATGGKQERVEVGSKISVEILPGDEGAPVDLRPVLIVDGETTHSGATALAGASVTATIVGESKGPKITGFIYKNKTNSRRRWGHRQHYTVVEVTDIAVGGSKARTSAKAAKA